MRKLMIPAAILITGLILSGSFFLPSYISGLRDRQTLETLSQAEGINISFESASNLSLIDRLSFLSNTGSVKLDNGRNLDGKTAYQRAVTELRSFNASGIMDFDFDSCEMTNCWVAFYIDSADPSKNLIAWSLFIEDASAHAVSVFIDDETGKLLSIGYAMVFQPDYYLKETIVRASTKKPLIDPDALIGALASYYGLQITRQLYDKEEERSKFLLTVTDGKSAADIGVAVTIDGFWFNI